MKSLAVVAVCLPALSVAAQAPAPSVGDSLRVISLQEALALAQRNAPGAVQARGALRTANAAVRSAYAQFLPNISSSVGTSRSAGQRFDNLRNEVVNVTNPASYSASVSASVELFDGGRRFADIRAAKADEDAQEAGIISTRFNIALQVKQAYTNILAARESEAAARASLEQAEAQMRASVARVQAGAATVSDSLRSLIQVGNARLSLLNAQNNLRVQSATLTRLVGTPFLVTADPADTVALQPVVIDSVNLIRWALEGPSVRQAEMSVRSAGASVLAARTAYLPTVNLSSSISGNGTNPWGFGSDTSQRFLVGRSLYSIGLSFPIFNRFQREDNVMRARVTQDNAAASLREARLLAQQNIIQQLGALRVAEANIRIQQASVQAAEEDLRVQNQRYALGASTILEQLTSQSALNQARVSLIQARQQYRIARAQIESTIGRDLQ